MLGSSIAARYNAANAIWHGSGEGSGNLATEIRRLAADRQPGRIIRANEAELAEHAARLEVIAKAAGSPSLWAQLLDAKGQTLQ